LLVAQTEISMNRKQSSATASHDTTDSRHDETKTSTDNCNQCLNHLTSILDAINSKPKALFEAMGVKIDVDNNSHSASHSLSKSNSTTNSNIRTGSDRKSFWEMDHNTKGVIVKVPKQINSIQQNVLETVSSGFGGNTTSGVNSKNIQDKEKYHDTGGTMTDTNKNSGNFGVENENETVLYKLKKRLTKSLHSKSKQPSSPSTTVMSELVPETINLATSPTHSQNSKSISKTNDNDDYITLKIQCQTCGSSGPEGSARAYVRGPSPLSIILCSNRLSLLNTNEINQVLTHELIHVFDVHYRKWDLTNCYNLAKSEIRAAREAECDNSLTSFDFMKRFCVKDKAKVATTNMFPDIGLHCVNQVFDEAIGDNEPFFKSSSPRNESDR